MSDYEATQMESSASSSSKRIKCRNILKKDIGFSKSGVSNLWDLMLHDLGRSYVIIIGIKYTINVMHWNCPETTRHNPWKNWVVLNEEMS